MTLRVSIVELVKIHNHTNDWLFSIKDDHRKSDNQQFLY